MILLVVAVIAVTALLIFNGRKNKKNTDIAGANWDPLAYSKAVAEEFDQLCKEMPDEFQEVLSSIASDVKPTTKVFSRTTDGVKQTEMLIIEEKYKEKLVTENRSKREVAFYAIEMAIVRHYHKDTVIEPSKEYSSRVKTLYLRCVDELEKSGFHTQAEAETLRNAYLQDFENDC